MKKYKCYDKPISELPPAVVEPVAATPQESAPPPVGVVATGPNAFDSLGRFVRFAVQGETVWLPGLTEPVHLKRFLAAFAAMCVLPPEEKFCLEEQLGLAGKATGLRQAAADLLDALV